MQQNCRISKNKENKKVQSQSRRITSTRKLRAKNRRCLEFRKRLLFLHRMATIIKFQTSNVWRIKSKGQKKFNQAQPSQNSLIKGTHMHHYFSPNTKRNKLGNSKDSLHHVSLLVKVQMLLLSRSLITKISNSVGKEF